jgi:peptidoglycan/LPS O-acetylase OafA/YrhL
MSLSAMSWHLPFYRTSQHLSDFSYSVYLVHFPVLVFALSLCYQVIGSGIRMPFHLGAFLWYLTVLMLSFLASWIISLFTEKKTPVLRSLIYQVLKIEAKP